MVYHKGQSWDLYSSASILMIYLCIYHQILQNVICSRMTQHFKQQEKAFCKFKKTLQLCLDRISVWCNVNNMLINPVKTKSMIITTRQKHQLSDLTLRLSLDGQNIENVTKHPCLNAHIKPHIDYPSVVWDGCGQVHLKELNSLHRRAGKLILPDPSLSTEQTMNALGILNLSQKLAYNKGIFMHKVLNKKITQIAWHNSLLVTSFITPTPGISSTCRGQGLTYFKLACPSLERPSGTPCLKI